MISSKTTFWGYRRENGRVGVRNHVIILPLDDLARAEVEAAARQVATVTALVPLALVFAGVIVGSMHGLDSKKEVFPTPPPAPTASIATTVGPLGIR